MRVAKVYIEHPVAKLDKAFDYYVLENMSICEGVRVEIEFNRQILVGYVEQLVDVKMDLEEYIEQCGFEIKPILRVIDDQPLLNDELKDIAHFLAHTNIAPTIACYQTILPPSLKPSSGEKVKIKYQKCIKIKNLCYEGLTAKQQNVLQFFEVNGDCFYKDLPISKSIVDTLITKGILQAYKKEVYRSPFDEKVKFSHKTYKLTDEQQKCIEIINENKNSSFLLEGVTGSGKTEVYINLTKQVIDGGKNVLILVPEISLTPSMVKRFKERLTVEVAILHSGLTPGEKYDEYRRIARKEVRVVIGARSAIFAPLDNIGLIVIDEEHSESYKQDNTPSYHTIDVALKRQKYHNCTLILGSATPSLETKARAVKGLYHTIYLTKRINNLPLPNVEIVDMVNEPRMGNFSLFSRSLKENIERCLDNDEQVILLLNRRGYAISMHCSKCGFIYKCPDCGVALHYHREDETLKCHYCGFEISKPKTCENCGSRSLITTGIGTQKVQEIITNLFEKAKVVRMDADTVKRKNGHREILEDFENKKYNILLGTQMIAKGLDFPNVTLVGVINADTSLYCGDFRANERTFQLLTQVIGRSGRGALKGKAIIQTYNPDAYSIALAAQQDYQKFFKLEMQYRRDTMYPPYRYLTSLMILSHSQENVIKYSSYIKNLINELKGNIDLTILGPAEPFIPKLNKKFRMRIMLKYKDKEAVINLLHSIRKIAIDQNIEVHYDTSPFQNS